MSRFTIHGWPVSPYTEKTRGWLRYKQLPTDEVVPSMWGMRQGPMKAVGRFVMPTVQTPDGRWLQDSRVILDTLEAEHPNRPSEPSTPRQRLVSAVFEVYGDEWLILAALHYRWHLPGNKRFAIAEFARHGLPWMPGFLGRRVMGQIAKRMQVYAPKFGVVPATYGGVETSTTRFIALLQEHLSQHRYLLGGRPCMGDFALMGSLWAHLERDVASTFLFDDAPDVRVWTKRLRDGDDGVGEYLDDDAIPDTLLPLLREATDEPWVYLRRVLEGVDAWRRDNPQNERLPRALGDVPFVIGGHEGSRRLITFHAWKAQRVVERLVDPDWVAEVMPQLADLPPVHRQRFVPYRLVLE